MECHDLLDALRRRGVAVLHAVKEIRHGHDADQFLIYLEGARGDADLARITLERLPGVERVAFACHTRSMLHVYAPRPRAVPRAVSPVVPLARGR